MSPAVAILQESTHFNVGGASCINMFKFEEQLQFRIYIISALCSVEDIQRIFCRDAFFYTIPLVRDFVTLSGIDFVKLHVTGNNRFTFSCVQL